MTRNPVLIALDGDAAGAAGAARWIRQIAELGGVARAVRLPAGTDPADLIARGGVQALDLMLSQTSTAEEVLGAARTGRTTQGWEPSL